MIEKLQQLLGFFTRNRQNGYTSLIEAMAFEHDIHVLVTSEEEKKMFHSDVRDKLISLSELKKLNTLENKPLLFDNHVILDILREVLLNSDKKDEEINEHIYTIEILEEIIKQRKNGKYKDHFQQKGIVPM